ncbi:MAG: hypothetical protein J0L72_05380 [Armatimonadetes bacterium]|nr:hypothetical protein [Armatimonadota bacterium]
MTRKEFDAQVEEVRHLLREMGDTVCKMTLDAVEGAVGDDPELLDQVAAQDLEVDALESRIMEQVFRLIVLQAPVASDARLLTSTISIVGELEQAGDDAVKLARRAKKIGGNFRDDLRAPLGALAESVVQMISDAVELYEDYNEERAIAIVQADEMIDSAYKKARKRIMELANEDSAMREMFRTIEIFHALEHVADHAVEIAKRLQVFHR